MKRIFLLIITAAFVLSSCYREEAQSQENHPIFFLDKNIPENLISFGSDTYNGAYFSYRISGRFLNDGKELANYLKFNFNGWVVTDTLDYTRFSHLTNSRTVIGKSLDSLDGKPIEVSMDHPIIGFKTNLLNFPNLKIDSLDYSDREVSKQIGTTYTWKPHGFSTDTTRMRVVLSYFIRNSLKSEEESKTKFIDIPDNGVFHLTPALLAEFPPLELLFINFERASYTEFLRPDGERVGFIKYTSNFGGINLRP